MSETQATEVIEEYLETIYRLQSRQGDGAKTSELTKSLKVVPGTVTNTIERLEREGYVEHQPYRGVKLTEKGQNIALQVLRRHRLSERLLTDILRVDPSKAHEVACKIEHDIADEEIIKKIEDALGNPKTCPHGNPIPPRHSESKKDELETERLTPLADLQISDRGVVARLGEDDPDVLRYLSSRGLRPGVTVEIIKKGSTDGAITMQFGHAVIHSISQKIASSIIVRKMEPADREIVQGSEAAASSLVDEFGDYES